MIRTISDQILRPAPVLRADDVVRRAVREVLDSGLPGLPVVDADERYVGIFGEREFLGALFPGYVAQLRGSGFLTRTLDEALERRESCAAETVGQHMTTDHVDVAADHADLQLAEIFLHHRVLIVPVIAPDRAVAGVILRRDFFRTLAERFLAELHDDS
jgi:CBS domain-containing protein